jgi:deoxycytidylate deaminase
VAVKNGNILALGWNVDINHPAQMSEEHIKARASLHAEMRALAQVSNAKGVTLYVARINRKGVPAMSKPCIRCQDALQSLGVKKVIHT